MQMTIHIVDTADVFQIPTEEKRSWYFKMATIYMR